MTKAHVPKVVTELLYTYISRPPTSRGPRYVSLGPLLPRDTALHTRSKWPLLQPLPRTCTEAENGGQPGEKPGSREATQEGSNVGLHQGSCQEASNQQRGQLAAALSVPPGTRQSPSPPAFSSLIGNKEWVLHCTLSWPFTPPPRAAAPRVPRLDLMARVAAVSCPTNSHGGHWSNSRCQQRRILPQIPTLWGSSIMFAPQFPLNLLTPSQQLLGAQPREAAPPRGTQPLLQLGGRRKAESGSSLFSPSGLLTLTYPLCPRYYLEKGRLGILRQGN